MTKDQELLAFAAVAVNEGIWFDTYEFRKPHGRSTSRPWNPLEDDGDALRVAVRLELTGLYYTSEDWTQSNHDGYAATRRSIVRAAAARGRALITYDELIRMFPGLLKQETH